MSSFIYRDPTSSRLLFREVRGEEQADGAWSVYVTVNGIREAGTDVFPDEEAARDAAKAMAGIEE